MLNKLSASDFERFWSKVDMSGDCWLWTGSIDPDGRGRFSVWNRSHSGLVAPQLAYEMAHGTPPDAWVLHSCDTPRCVRPTHLRTGTPAENSRDMLVRERNISKKLKAVQVLEIRRRYAACGVTQLQLAREFHVCQGTIQWICSGRTWRFLSEPFLANKTG